MSTGIPLEYVLPLRCDRHDEAALTELAAYLHGLTRLADVTVVDGSPPELFDRHAAAFGPAVRHLRPDPDLCYANGKVNGVTTGVRTARHEHVVLADDDVRYDEPQLRRICALLTGHDLVRPQNYFAPVPWHARWDTARTLLNRATGADFPGTFGLRRSTFLAMGGYDGDVLFENLELIRTVEAYGGSRADVPDLYVRRLPPETGRFWQQRVRQAYDELARPVRLTVFLAVLPVAVASLLSGLWVLPPVWCAAAVLVAEAGRRRAGGRRVFPRTAALFAPMWVLERATCVWLAVGLRVFRGGVRYAGRRLCTAAHSVAEIRATAGNRAAGRFQTAAR